MWQRAVVEVDKKDILGERCEQVECPRLENCLCPSQNDSVSILGSSVAEKEREKRKKKEYNLCGAAIGNANYSREFAGARQKSINFKALGYKWMHRSSGNSHYTWTLVEPITNDTVVSFLPLQQHCTSSLTCQSIPKQKRGGGNKKKYSRGCVVLYCVSCAKVASQP